MRRRLPLALVAALALAAGGCDWYYNTLPSPDDALKLVPWFDHMVRSPAVHPFESAGVPREPVPGTVPVTGARPDWAAEWATGNTTTADALVNPYAAGTDTLVQRPAAEVAVIPASVEARGDTLWQTFCATCHGDQGEGMGIVGRLMGAPPVTTPRAAAFTDGYLYSIIRYGRGVMPRYGDKIYADADRWAVVLHMRKLQQAAQPAAPATATTGGTQ